MIREHEYPHVHHFYYFYRSGQYVHLTAKYCTKKDIDDAICGCMECYAVQTKYWEEYDRTISQLVAEQYEERVLGWAGKRKASSLASHPMGGGIQKNREIAAEGAT